MASEETVPAVEQGQNVPESVAQLQEAMKTLNGEEQLKQRKDLEAEIDRLLQDLWTESLRVVEEILHHDPTKDDAEKQRLFLAYRSRILNAGNQQKRQVPMILRDFFVNRVLRRVAVTRVMPKRKDGGWGLPRGVKHPSEK